MDSKGPRSSSLRVASRFACTLLPLWFLGACHTPSASQPRKTPGWEDHRLPNAPQPYEKLLVEIDAVEGTEPTAEDLADLRSFLETATNKPGGVTIKVDNIIPKKTARERPPNALALEYLNGPPDDHTAFLYILCYRSKLAGLFKKPDNPNFTYLPYPCAIFVDRSYTFWGLANLAPTVFRRAIMRHEVGHALGLAGLPTHSKDGHCTNDGCLMQPAIAFSFRRLLKFQQPWENTELCADCRRDLESYKSAAPRPDTRMWHGYFVHAGEGYQIFTLPAFYYVRFDGTGDLDEADLAEGRRTAVESAVGGHSFRLKLRLNFPNDLDAVARFVAHEDADEDLQTIAEDILNLCIAKAEEFLATEREAALAIASEQLIAAAARYPELQAKLKALRDRLAEPAPATAER